MITSRRFALFAVLATGMTMTGAGSAAAQTPDAPRATIEIEGGPWWTSRNDVRIPPATGTEFSMTDLTGSGPSAYVRIAATFRLAARHQLRLVAAPVQATGSSILAMPVTFVDQTFAPDVRTEGTYKFNTYRIGYRYTLHEGRDWHVEIGAALLTRDAKIELRQGGQTARDTDLGFVPLASFMLSRRLSDRAAFVVDVEGLGSKQGRAVDALLKVEVGLSDRWALGVGYRTIEGGADVDAVYNFAWLHFGVASLRYRF